MEFLVYKIWPICKKKKYFFLNNLIGDDLIIQYLFCVTKFLILHKFTFLLKKNKSTNFYGNILVHVHATHYKDWIRFLKNEKFISMLIFWYIAIYWLNKVFEEWNLFLLTAQPWSSVECWWMPGPSAAWHPWVQCSPGCSDAKLQTREE